MRNNLFDVAVTIGFGFFGFLMVKAGYPVPPMLLGIILGPIVESNLGRTLLISDGDLFIFFKRPICWLFIVLIVVTVGTGFKNRMKMYRS
jgi:putative tricarboxylic transport membrane protein